LKTPSYSNRDELQIKTVIDHDLKDLDDLWEFVIGIVLPLNVKLNSGISVFENSIISVLSGLKDINHFFDYSSSSFKSWLIY
jgi:hypothetical protein